MPSSALASVTISQEALESELLAMTDWHTDLLALTIANNAYTLGNSNKLAGTMINHLSRFAIDPERFPDSREEMNSVGMGAVYTHGSERQQIRVASEDETQDLINEYFHPYALALQDSVTRKLKQHGHAFIIDLHSYSSEPMPYELHGDSERPEICIGFDSFHCSEELRSKVASIFENAGYTVGFNTPFAGTYIPLKYYGIDSRVSSIMLELRRDIYLDEQTGSIKEEKYSRLLAPLSKVVDFLNDL